MFFQRGVAVLALGGTLTLGGGLAALPAGAAPGDPVVNVTSRATGLTVSTTQVDAGQIVFNFASTLPASQTGPGGADVTLLRLTGASLANVEAHIRAQNGDGTPASLAKAAASTQWLADSHNVVFFGGAALQGVGKARTVNILEAGTYKLLDVNSVFGGGPVNSAALTVVGHVHPSLTPRIAATIDTTTNERFRTTATILPANGRFLVRNTSDTIHFVVFQPVGAAVTDRDVSKAIANNTLGQLFTLPAGDTRTGVESDVLSPGRTQVFSSDTLAPGTYDLECFIADDVTGVPHFFMGMHKIVHIK